MKSKKVNLYSKFLGFLIKKGNKVVAKQILNSAFLIASKNTQLSLQLLLLKLFLKLNSFVEVKRVRIRRSSHVVPFAISFKRRLYLIIKWIMQAVHEDKRQISMEHKLAFEITNIIKNLPSKSLKIKEANILQALSNRSNAHFRW